MATEPEGKIGLTAAVAAIGEAVEPSAPVQLPLMPTERESEVAAIEQGERGRGRPPGARNKSTSAWIDYILARYPAPAVALAATYARPVQGLADELGCDKLEAFKVQIACATNLMPYIHQKQPLAVQVDARGVVQLVIALDPTAALAAEELQAEADGLVFEGEIVTAEQHAGIEQNQQDSEAPKP